MADFAERIFSNTRLVNSGRSRPQRAKPLKHEEKLSLYSGARQDWRKNRTLKISTVKSATIEKGITAACEAPTA